MNPIESFAIGLLVGAVLGCLGTILWAALAASKQAESGE